MGEATAHDCAMDQRHGRDGCMPNTGSPRRASGGGSAPVQEHDSCSRRALAPPPRKASRGAELRAASETGSTRLSSEIRSVPMSHARGFFDLGASRRRAGRRCVMPVWVCMPVVCLCACMGPVVPPVVTQPYDDDGPGWQDRRPQSTATASLTMGQNWSSPISGARVLDGPSSACCPWLRPVLCRPSVSPSGALQSSPGPPLAPDGIVLQA